MGSTQSYCAPNDGPPNIYVCMITPAPFEPKCEACAGRASHTEPGEVDLATLMRKPARMRVQSTMVHKKHSGEAEIRSLSP